MRHKWVGVLSSSPQMVQAEVLKGNVTNSTCRSEGGGWETSSAGAAWARPTGTYFRCSSAINDGLNKDPQICMVLLGTVPFDTDTKPRRPRVIKWDFKSQKLPGPVGREDNVLIFRFLKGKRIAWGIKTPFSQLLHGRAWMISSLLRTGSSLYPVAGAWGRCSSPSRPCLSLAASSFRPHLAQCCTKTERDSKQHRANTEGNVGSESLWLTGKIFALSCIIDQEKNRRKKKL